MAGLSVVTAPTTEPLTRTEVKSFLRIDTTDDDTLVDVLIETARQFAEEYIGRTLIHTTYKLSLDGFIEDQVPIKEGLYQAPYMNFYKRFIPLPRPPLVSVTHLKTFDDADTESTFASSKYFVDTQRNPGRLVLRDGETFPTGLRVANGVEITYVGGYGSSSSAIPSPIKLVMREHITFLYEHRGDVEPNLANFPLIAKQLYQPFRVLSFSNNPFSNAGGY